MAEMLRRRQFVKDLNQFLADEKVLAIIDHSRGTAGGGTVFVQSGGSYKPGETTTVPQLTMASEHWSRIARLLDHKKDVTLELNVTNTFYDDDPMQYDTIAEIPGGDKKDEVVMLGAHLDSWHAGTGATDNGAGTIVMMEAMRILKASILNRGGRSASACGAAKKKDCWARRAMWSSILVRVRRWTIRT